MSTTITLELAQERIGALATANPRHIAPGVDDECRYFEADGTPSCIVGTAFPDELRAAGVNENNEFNTSALLGIRNDTGLLFEDDAFEYLASAQRTQDRGCDWQAAHEEAEFTLAQIVYERETEAEYQAAKAAALLARDLANIQFTIDQATGNAAREFAIAA